ncbi:MAG: cytochrome P450 [Deltaproteobacteria bacterium]|nr:cytochrome P450 [Deltaproteobacteria bacterium]
MRFDMTRERDGNDLYGLVSPDIFFNPHPLYHMLRYSEPVHFSPVLNAWVLTRYEDVVAAFKDPRLSNAMRRAAGTAKLAPELQAKMAPIDRFLLLWVLNLDDPEHHRLRVLLSKAFTPKVMDAMRPKILEITHELLDAVCRGGEFEFISQLAHPLPVRVIADLFGIPNSERDRFAAWSKHISTFFEVGPAKTDALDRMNETVVEMTEYLRTIVEENRRSPKDNLLGHLIRAEEQSDVLTEEQLLATCIMILFAGHDSTVNLIGSGMLSLLQHPDQLERLKRDPTLISSAVDEFLRFESPVMRHDRVAKEDFSLHGHEIKRGQRVVLGIGAANRDPLRYPNPDVLDIGRKSNRHLTFGYGPHACLGGALACTQAEVALLAAIDRLPNLRVTGPMPIWRQHFNFRGLRSLHVAFDPVVNS